VAGSPACSPVNPKALIVTQAARDRVNEGDVLGQVGHRR
jgi:hypothetical protein